ncbi:hypothetical protein DSCA_14740 [Desulfosarcina alkanivorans]|uniref:Uncharacterized protein n=1 Tax=Desulfosarcina alkanivorans TaxID=571177 RepID=A0A5K7YMG1_9BACT|nr:hypothetical protein [Desulfosarcina alkanivorans]BBO67544.1 hypothetical protein DSCA_14740 [Desulfosarcina alkanivorans]
MIGKASWRIVPFRDRWLPVGGRPDPDLPCCGKNDGGPIFFAALLDFFSKAIILTAAKPEKKAVAKIRMIL